MNGAPEQPELVVAAVAGDRAALTVLLTESHAELCGFIWRRVPSDLRSQLDAEDVVQAAHVEVFRHIATFAPQGDDAFGRWLRTIALRRLRNAIRDRRAAKRGGTAVAIGGALENSATSLLSLMAVSEHTPSRSAAGHEAAAAVQAALSHLNDEQRTAVRLVYLNGMSAEAAATEMGKTPRAVYNLCDRAKRRLEELLGSRSRYFGASG